MKPTSDNPRLEFQTHAPPRQAGRQTGRQTDRRTHARRHRQTDADRQTPTHTEYATRHLQKVVTEDIDCRSSDCRPHPVKRPPRCQKTRCLQHSSLTFRLHDSSSACPCNKTPPLLTAVPLPNTPLSACTERAAPTPVRRHNTTIISTSTALRSPSTERTQRTVSVSMLFNNGNIVLSGAVGVVAGPLTSCRC